MTPLVNWREISSAPGRSVGWLRRWCSPESRWRSRISMQKQRAVYSPSLPVFSTAGAFAFRLMAQSNLETKIKNEAETPIGT